MLKNEFMTQQRSYKAKVGSGYGKSFRQGTSVEKFDFNFLIVTKTHNQPHLALLYFMCGIVIFYMFSQKKNIFMYIFRKNIFLNRDYILPKNRKDTLHLFLAVK